MQSSLRKWIWVHKWSSLVCTVFLLMLCLTGLPLIFKEEIGDLLDTDPPYETLPAETQPASLDTLMGISQQLYPGQIVTSIFIDDDEPQTIVNMAPSWQAMRDNPKSSHWIKFDSRTAKVLKRSELSAAGGPTFMGVMLTLHRDMFAGLPGELFLGLMGLLFVAAIVSGIVIYTPFMRKLDFGTVRRNRSRRAKWLDLHNLLGVATATWVFVVGLTGVINELSTPMIGLWLMTDVKAMLEPMKGKPVPAPDELSSPQNALDLAKQAMPGMTPMFMIFPGAQRGSPWHYAIQAKGNEALSSRLVSFAVVDGKDGTLFGVLQMPWYLRVLELSRPLHFGDYGGMPLKIIWALLDIVTIVILGSGLYLWLAKRSSANKIAQKLAADDVAALPAMRPGAAE